jgi:hypothetical protein
MAVSSAAAARSTAIHIFLKLSQPIDEADLPQPRIAEAGKTYKFPFTFVVPGQLLPHSCTHKCQRDQVHDSHLQLPPSLGEQIVAGNGISPLDDFAPFMSEITYAINVHVSRHRDSDDSDVTLIEKGRKIRIIPASGEAPPLSIGSNSEYLVRKERGLRKGLLKGKLGRLTMEAVQPQSLRLAPPKSVPTSPTTTMAKINLRFDPADVSSQPPKLQQLNSTLHVQTYFSSRPMSDVPTRASTVYDGSRGSYVNTVSLSTRCVESAQWTLHKEDPFRRDSAYSSMSSSSLEIPEAPSLFNGSPFYTTQVLVPITLPTNKAFVPTFHSCLVSRIYQLELSLVITPPGKSSTTSSTKLLVPIQVSAAGNVTSETLPQFEQAADVDTFFAPRTVAPPAAEFLQRGSIVSVEQPQTPETILSPAPAPMQVTVDSPPPPGYSYFAGIKSSMPANIPSPIGVLP